jgi:hypothetical protein
MAQTLLEEFLEHEADDYVRGQLLDAIRNLGDGRRYFTFNVFNVLLDAGSGTATVEDELDVNRRDTVPLTNFVQLLTDAHGDDLQPPPANPTELS